MTTELYHYGIPGMHWGVRRTPEQLGHTKKSVSDMSNREIKKAISAAKKQKKANNARQKLEDDYLEYVEGKKVDRSKRDYSRDYRKAKQYIGRKGDRMYDRVSDAIIDIGSAYIKKELGLSSKRK